MSLAGNTYLLSVKFLQTCAEALAPGDSSFHQDDSRHDITWLPLIKRSTKSTDLRDTRKTFRGVGVDTFITSVMGMV